jgi:hypothetical protein
VADLSQVDNNNHQVLEDLFNQLRSLHNSLLHHDLPLPQDNLRRRDRRRLMIWVCLLVRTRATA